MSAIICSLHIPTSCQRPLTGPGGRMLQLLHHTQQHHQHTQSVRKLEVYIPINLSLSSFCTRVTANWHTAVSFSTLNIADVLAGDQSFSSNSP
jgi:hypothetical protein